MPDALSDGWPADDKPIFFDSGFGSIRPSPLQSDGLGERRRLTPVMTLSADAGSEEFLRAWADTLADAPLGADRWSIPLRCPGEKEIPARRIRCHWRPRLNVHGSLRVHARRVALPADGTSCRPRSRRSRTLDGPTSSPRSTSGTRHCSSSRRTIAEASAAVSLADSHISSDSFPNRVSMRINLIEVGNWVAFLNLLNVQEAEVLLLAVEVKTGDWFPIVVID